MVGLVVALFLPTLASAQGSDAEARNLFEAGEVAYSEGRYESALDYFRRAHELSGRPLLLYNIGTAAEHLLRYDEAVAAFDRYLVEVPDAPNRAAVESRLTILRGHLAEAEADEPAPVEVATPDPVDTTPSPPPPAGGGTDVGAFVVLGVGGALALGGAVLVGVGYADAMSVSGAPLGSTWSTVSDAYSRAPILEGVGFALVGVGVAALAGGIGWAVAGSGSSETTVTAWADPTGAGIVVGGAL